MFSKKIILIIFLVASSFAVFSQQQQQPLPYNPKADAQKQLDSVLAIAKTENKNIFIQIGGNWCPWCVKMHNFYTSDQQIDSLMKADYVRLMVNYSKENKNLPVMTRFGYPQRFGFPVIIILDSDGNRLHTQNTAYLEENGGYSKEKFMEFLKGWNKTALDPNSYK